MTIKTKMSMKLLLILILSIGLVQSKTFDDAFDEFIEFYKKHGTGTCSSWKFQTLTTTSKICVKSMESQLTFSHHCTMVGGVMLK